MKTNERLPIETSALALKVFERFNDRWMLLTAGENQPGAFNVMTISWGALGVLWNKPAAFVFVRPSRYTYTFMEKSNGFTLCVFPGEYKDELTLTGTRSGRAMDKVKACGLTPVASQRVAAPGFDEAELILECRKMYFDDIKPANFLSEELESNYGGSNYHRMFIGEILYAEGTADYRG